jgi:predicted alpha/beta superfamily hydrolase
VRGRWLLRVGALLVLPAAGQAQTPPGPAPQAPYLTETLRSSVLGEDRRLLIRLPPGYDADSKARYPVLYKLDGDNGLRSFDESLAALRGSAGVREMIIVAIPNGRGQRNRDLTPASLHQESASEGGMGTGEMGRGDRFLDFIERELIPHVEKNYRTEAERVFVGHSRGALLVVQSLLSKPSLFAARFVFSAPLMRDEQRLIKDTRKFLAEHADHRSSIYFNWGEQ